MKKKYFFIILFAFVAILTISPKNYAKDLDEIVNYNVTVEPRMSDGTLDIIYQITWKVLDSTSEGPLEWVKIGTQNDKFDTPIALTKNIKSIEPYTYNGSYVKIVFDKKYYAGEQITFKYKIHQSYMYKLSFGKCKYSFTPAWFKDAKVDNMTVKWNMNEVESCNTRKKEGKYLVWNKTNMNKGEKLKVKVDYNTSDFGYLSKYQQSKNVANNTSLISTIAFTFALIFIVSLILQIVRGGSYYRHRGFYGGYHNDYYDSDCVRSSCACASSCASSCACACAGSGRAGCSKKDFYGTKINKSKLKEALK